MNNLAQRVPRSFIERNDEWMQSSQSDSNLLRWNKKGSNLVAISSPSSLYCDIFVEQERSAPAFGFSSEKDRIYGSNMPGIDDLRSSDDMLDVLLGQNARFSHAASDIRNYLSSTYLNPKLKSHIPNFGPYGKRTNFPKI
jgi:hypothetical protein